MQLYIFLLIMDSIIPVTSYTLLHKHLQKSLLHSTLSLKQTFETLSDLRNLKYCTKNSFSVFANTPCGLIEHKPSHEEYIWNVIPNHKTSLEWTFYHLEVERKEFKCLESSVLLKSLDLHLTLCGFYLPWKETMRGHDISITQRCRPYTHCQFTFMFVSKPQLSIPKSDFHANISLIDSFQYYTKQPQSDRLLYFLVGSHVMRVLLVNITQQLIDCFLFDGPAVLTPLLYSCADHRKTTPSQSYYGNVTASSFQALLVLTHSFNPTGKIILEFNEEMRKDMGEKCRGNYYFSRITCTSYNVPHNGLAHVKIHSTLAMTLILDSFEFDGPDVFTIENTRVCQYGGLWLLTSDTQDFHDQHIILNICPHGWPMNSTWNLQISRTKQYVAVVTIQYSNVSTTKLKYSGEVHPPGKSGGLFEIPSQPFVLNKTIENINILLNLDKERNFSLQLDSFGKRTKVSAVHLSADMTYSCTIDMFYPVQLHDAWCTTGEINKEEWRIKRIQSSFAGLQQEESFKQYKDKYSIKQISVNCQQNPSAYIHLSIQQFYWGGLYKFLPSSDTCTVNTQSISANENEVILVIQASLVSAPILFLQVDLHNKPDTPVTLLECSNGTKQTVTHYRTENHTLQFLTKACHQDCLLIVKQESSGIANLFEESKGRIDIRMCPFVDGIDLYNMSISSSISSYW